MMDQSTDEFLTLSRGGMGGQAEEMKSAPPKKARACVFPPHAPYCARRANCIFEKRKESERPGKWVARLHYLILVFSKKVRVSFKTHHQISFRFVKCATKKCCPCLNPPNSLATTRDSQYLFVYHFFTLLGHQFHFPKSVAIAGTRIALTTKVSRRMPIATASPI